MEMKAVFRKEVWIDDNAFPIDREEFDIADMVREMTIDELEGLVTELQKTSCDLDYIAARAGLTYDGPYTVIIDDLELADFMIANGLDCPSANRNPNGYADDEIVGWAGADNDPSTGAIVRWALETNSREERDETVDEIGFHNLNSRETYALGLDRNALDIAKTRFSIDRTILPYQEAFDISAELKELNLSVRRPS